MKQFSIRTLAFLTLCAASGLAWSWAGSVQGQIATFDVAPGNNYGVRITMKLGGTMCGSDITWAYLNEADSNYKVYVSALLAAKISGSTVTIYTERDAGTGYCHIGYISVS